MHLPRSRRREATSLHARARRLSLYLTNYVSTHQGKYPDDRPIDESKVDDAAAVLLRGLKECSTLQKFREKLDSAGEAINLRVDKWVHANLDHGNKQVSEGQFDNCVALLKAAFGDE